jgi:hypothetical protein
MADVAANSGTLLGMVRAVPRSDCFIEPIDQQLEVPLHADRQTPSSRTRTRARCCRPVESQSRAFVARGRVRAGAHAREQVRVNTHGERLFEVEDFVCCESEDEPAE